MERFGLLFGIGAACCALAKPAVVITHFAKSRRFINEHPTSWYAIPHREMAQHYPALLPVVKRIVEMNAASARSPSAIAVLHKAFDVLDVLQAADSAMSLDQLVDATRIARSTAHRLLLNLIARGYVERTSSGKFALGLKLLELGATVRQHQSLRDIARPVMLDLRNRLGETINLGKLRGTSVLYLETIESEHAFRVSASLGIRDPLHVTSIGKAILAWLPLERRPVLNDWRQLTPATITEPARFAEELVLTKKRGYALDEEESMQGGRCIGVPILQGGYPVAGLSVSGPVARVTRDRIKGIANDLREAAGLISDQMRLHPETD